MTGIEEKDLKWWTKKLNKTDLKHLRENGVRNTYDLSIQMDFVIKENRKFHDNEGKRAFVCWHCMAIARKLGVA